MADYVLRDGLVVCLRGLVRALVLRICLQKQFDDSLASLKVEIELARRFRIESGIEFGDRLSGVIAFRLQLRETNEDAVLFRLAVLLDRRVGQLAAETIHRYGIIELQDD